MAHDQAMSLQTAYLLKKSLTEKSHTFEGGTHTHLMISAWYLLMNLKNNYLLKNC